MKIKTGDTVLIILGRDRGKTGKVLEIFPKSSRIMVEGINIVKKHVKSKKSGEKGQRVEVPRSLNVSNVKLICPSCKRAVRVGYKILENKKRIRICNKCGQDI
jgi:large subunit ribosomal protein L24